MSPALHLPGDDLVPDPDVVMDRNLNLPAPAADVWPWLIQLGKGRAGWYMPDVIEQRLIPPKRRASRRLEERWQDLAVGDEIDDWGGQDAKLKLVRMEHPQLLVWTTTRPRRSKPPIIFSWAQLLRDTADNSCALHLRLRIDLAGGRTWLARYGGGAVDWLTVTLLERGLRERLVTARASA